MAKQSKELPFELLFPDREVGVAFCGVSIPKYGSLTPNEHIAIGDIEYTESDGSSKPILLYYAEVAVVMLRSRVPGLKHYTATELMALPIPRQELEDLFNFMVGESRQWREEAAPEKKEEPGIGVSATGNSDSPTQENLDLSEPTLATALSA